MLIDTVRQHCLSHPGAREDIKWEDALVFSVARKMFAVLSMQPPHALWFKCAPDRFAELVERDGIVPAPYLARASWVSVEELGEGLEWRELRELLTASYDLVVARLPRKTREGLVRRQSTRRTGPPASRRRRSS